MARNRVCMTIGFKGLCVYRGGIHFTIILSNRNGILTIKI
jgi:hypothetical protein